MFGFRISDIPTDEVTHLVVKTSSNNIFGRTAKTGNAIVAHQPIVNYKWVLDCLKTNSFLSEVV